MKAPTAPSRTRRAAALIAAGAVLCSPFLLVIGVAFAVGGGNSPTPTPGLAAVVPPRALAAYQHGAADACPGVDWTLLAAIGAVESRHGQTATATIDDSTGESTPWIFGPPLDGQAGTAQIPAGDWIGWWGLTGPWAQAVGPMQFLPTTFSDHAVDADQDGQTNPHDLDDAATAAARYLCAAGGGAVEGETEAARIYNPGDQVAYAGKLKTERTAIQTAAEAGPALPAGPIACPVGGPVEFTDTWGAPRSGGRTHKGVDMFADRGTPVVAPTDGELEHFTDPIGGLSYGLTAADGTYYYGTHLDALANENATHVTAGTTIGYVGTSGNAAGTPPHLHWQIHPNGRSTTPANPTQAASAACG